MKIIEIAPPQPGSNQTIRSYISDTGLAFTTYNNGSSPVEIDGMVLYPKSAGSDGTGYIRVKVRRKEYYLHRLIATHFVKNPQHKPVVNHIDGDKKNNRADNLEWVTYSENTAHAVEIGLIKRAGKTELWCNACNKPALATWCVEELEDKQVRWRKHRDVARRKVSVPDSAEA